MVRRLIAVPLANILRLAAPSHHLLVFPPFDLVVVSGLRLDDGLVRTKLVKPGQSLWRWSLCQCYFWGLQRSFPAMALRCGLEYGIDFKGASTL